MKVVLFDSILERHPVQSLARALRARRHEVRITGLTFTGHATTTDDIKLGVIEHLFAAAMAEEPDLIVSFRPMNLPLALLRKARRRGIRTAIWLSDDPVLYRTDSSRVVDEYDFLLHCGGRRILSFYDRKKHPKGINFPFWTDNIAFPYCYDPGAADLDFVFLGNVAGAVRQKRYETLAGVPGTLRIFGNVPDDPKGLSAGNIAEGYANSLAVSEALARARCAISIPQFFDTYAGSEYDFPELRDLGFFQFPSRVIQYAASGLPIISVGDEEVARVFPELILVPDEDALQAAARAVHAGEYDLAEISERTRQRFRQSFSATARVLLLEKLVSGEVDPAVLSLDERAEIFGAMSPPDSQEAVQGGYGAPSEIDRHYAGAVRSILGAADSARAIVTHIETRSKILAAEVAGEIAVEAVMEVSGATAAGAAKEVNVSYGDDGLSFSFAEDAPRAGDRCELRLGGFVAADGKDIAGAVLSFVLSNPYLSPENRRYIRIETWVNGTLSLMRDLGVSKDPELVQIGIPSGARLDNVTVRLRAKSDCQAWRWDNAAVVGVGRLRLRRGYSDGDLAVTGSDIHSRGPAGTGDGPRIGLLSGDGSIGDRIPYDPEHIVRADGKGFDLHSPAPDLRAGDRSEIVLGAADADPGAGGLVVTLRISSTYHSRLSDNLYLYVAAGNDLCGIEDISARAGENIVTIYHPGSPETLRIRIGLFARHAHGSVGWQDASRHRIEVLDVREAEVAQHRLAWSSPAMKDAAEVEGVQWRRETKAS